MDNLRDYRFKIVAHVPGGNAQRADSPGLRPLITHTVALWVVPAIMSVSIDFNREPRRAAEEIENIGADWVLATKVQSAWTRPEAPPQLSLWRSHGPAKRSRLVD